jgi:hypothetical protein
VCFGMVEPRCLAELQVILEGLALGLRANH